MDPTTPADPCSTNRPDSRPRRSSLSVSAISLVLAQPFASSLHLPDIAGLARTCRALKDASEMALVRSVSLMPRARVVEGAEEALAEEGVRLYSASAVDSFAKFVERWINGREGIDSCEDPMQRNEGENVEDVMEEIREGGSDGATLGLPASSSTKHKSTVVVPTLRLRQLALHLHQLSSSTSLLKILHLCALTLTHLRISHAEHLLAHDKRIHDALASLSHLTSLVIHGVGPRGCAFLKALRAPLSHVEVEFDPDWVLSVLSASPSSLPLSPPLVPVLFSDTSSSIGLLTPTPTPASSPAACALGGDAPGPALPDPIPLLAYSMSTLRSLRASNALLVTVADKLRYPRVKSLSLRLAGVPAVTPLVHAFPALAELYVYTPFDGCALSSALSPAVSVSPDPHPDCAAASMEKEKGRARAKARARPPNSHSLPSIHATRASNRTSQLYSSFPPLARVRGFAPGLYALGLTCAVRCVEVGRLQGKEEARALREVLKDAKPACVAIGLGRGWWDGDGDGGWGGGWMTGAEREREGGTKGTLRRKGPAKEKQKEEGEVCGVRRKKGERERERETARDALTSIFGGSLADDEVWAGVTDLVLRVEEPGNWKHVTRDILAMLLPLTSTLATFVLHWDRTSVPFDRIPHDDGSESESDDPAGDSNASMYPSSNNHLRSGAKPLSRTEAFARRIGEQNPALRYALFKILHDDPARPLLPSPNPKAAPPWSIRSPPATPTPTPTSMSMQQPAAPLCESRFFRIERSQGWLCLDTLPEAVAERVMAVGGLSFVDRVRYY